MTNSDGAVLCIGVFDGVHGGHRALLAEGRRQADALGLPFVAVTFDPHPMSIVTAHDAPRSLSTIDHRTELLLGAGADIVDVLPFDERMAAMTPEEFIAAELVARLRAKAIVVGEDFRFGHRAAGSVAVLASEGERQGFSVTGLGLVGDGERWSSTRIRSLLDEGDVRAAAEQLGRPYAIDGTVVHGDHRGRELGYPTANLAWTDDPVVPADGVYAGWLTVGGVRHPAAISVGTNPQFDGRERRVEAYVLDRDDLDLYGFSARIEFTERLRGQMTFDGIDGLMLQMAADVGRCRALLLPG